nr:MAG TPA: hypothetical protein [Caudoviricetes sp.]
MSWTIVKMANRFFKLRNWGSFYKENLHENWN